MCPAYRPPALHTPHPALQVWMFGEIADGLTLQEHVQRMVTANSCNQCPDTSSTEGPCSEVGSGLLGLRVLG